MNTLPKFLVILLLFIVFTPGSGTARKRKNPKPKTTMTLTNFPSEAVTEYTFHGGTALIKGKMTGYSAEKKPQNFTLSIRNFFTRQQQTLLVGVDDNGEFVSEVELPHAQFFTSGMSFFLFPGDTLECIYDVTAREMTVTGNNLSAQVSRMWPEWEKHYFDGIGSAYQVAQKGMKELMDYRDRNITLIDRLAQEVANGTLPLRAPDSVATDILLTGVWAQALTNVLEGHMYYKEDNKEAMKDEPLIDSVYYDFLQERESFLLDNPLLAFEPNQWVLANRAEFQLFYPKHNSSQWYTESDGPAILKYAFMLLLPKDYDAQVLHEIQERYKSTVPYTRFHYYNDRLKIIRQKLHTGNSFLFQVCLTRGLFDSILRMQADRLTPDYTAEYIASLLPLLSHPTVCRQCLTGYRRYVVQHEGNQATEQKTPEADAILKRITEPYVGNVLFLDFWSIGCGPCRAGMLSQRKLVEELKDRPVKFLYICDEKDSPRELSNDFLTRNNIRGEHIFISHDEWNYLKAKFNFSGIPFELIIDRNGTIHKLNQAPTNELFETYLQP